MTRKERLLSGWYGRFFSGHFTKQDGSHRPVWGVIKNDQNVPDHLIVVFDLEKKQYRRFNIDLPFTIKSGGDIVAAASKEIDEYYDAYYAQCVNQNV